MRPKLTPELPYLTTKAPMFLPGRLPLPMGIIATHWVIRLCLSYDVLMQSAWFRKKAKSLATLHSCHMPINPRSASVDSGPCFCYHFLILGGSLSQRHGVAAGQVSASWLKTERLPELHYLAGVSCLR